MARRAPSNSGGMGRATAVADMGPPWCGRPPSRHRTRLSGTRERERFWPSDLPVDRASKASYPLAEISVWEGDAAP